MNVGTTGGVFAYGGKVGRDVTGTSWLSNIQPGKYAREDAPRGCGEIVVVGVPDHQDGEGGQPDQQGALAPERSLPLCAPIWPVLPRIEARHPDRASICLRV